MLPPNDRAGEGGEAPALPLCDRGRGGLGVALVTARLGFARVLWAGVMVGASNLTVDVC